MTAEKLPNFQTLLVDELGNVTGTIANPLITSSSGGGGGTVDQGTPNTAPNTSTMFYVPDDFKPILNEGEAITITLPDGSASYDINIMIKEV